MICLMRERRFPVAFKCYHNYHKVGSVSNDNLFYRMVIHVHSDSVFRRYQKEMRMKPGLWPLYRGFFVDINLFKANKEKASEIANGNNVVGNVNGKAGLSEMDSLADQDANLMIKLKFLPYKFRTFLIRNGLFTLFKMVLLLTRHIIPGNVAIFPLESVIIITWTRPNFWLFSEVRNIHRKGTSVMMVFHPWILVIGHVMMNLIAIVIRYIHFFFATVHGQLRQMNIWGTSAGKQEQISKMLDEWALYIRKKYGRRQLSSAIYLSEVKPFLEQYARRSVENQALVGSVGNLVKAEDFLATVEGGRDAEGDLATEKEAEPSSPEPSVTDAVQRHQGLIVFFPGIPGCAKSALCKELLNAPGGFGDDRPVHSLMGDLIKGRYWKKVANELRKKTYSIILADKIAPNEEVWRQIENMCRSTRASAVPVVPDSEGSDSNPYSLVALSVFIFRVLQRVNDPGDLDKNSPNAGYVLLMFYHLYDGKSRNEFEDELVERFGSIIKMPLLKADRSPLPDPIKSVLEEGINLYKLHTSRHGRAESNKGSYTKEWAKWEKQLRETLSANADYLNSIQVPFESAVNHVREQLKVIAKGEYKAPSVKKRKLGALVLAAISLPVTEIQSLLVKLAGQDPKIERFLKDKDIKGSLKKAHVTLAHKRSHGVTAVANYGLFLHRDVPVEFNAILFTDKMAALEAQLGSIDDEKIASKDDWYHLTLWTAQGVPPKEANMLPQLHSQGKATRIEINPRASVTGKVEFY